MDCVVSQGTSRGTCGWESSLREKPQARTVFQAGTSKWSKPINLDMDTKNGLESQDEVVGILRYTTGTPTAGLTAHFNNMPRRWK